MEGQNKKSALIIGGAGGIGLGIAVVLANRDDYEKVYVLDKKAFNYECVSPKIESFLFDITNTDYSFLNRFKNIDTLMITAGFGRLGFFKDVTEQHIIDSFNVNTIGVIRVIRHFYNRLLENRTFRCGVMVSIAGYLSSPLFAVYSATKAALRIFIESVNVELLESGSQNCVLNVSPGSIRGTGFNSGTTNLEIVMPLAYEIVEELEKGNDLFIPQYDEVYREVLERYHKDFREEGRHSYEYKMKSGRVASTDSENNG